MRSFVNFLAGAAAFTLGFLLVVAAAKHPAETWRAWNIGGAWYRAIAASAGVYESTAPPSAGTPREFPAQANWTWHMPNGKTYENVVITDLSPSEVTITHSLGIAHLPIASLPPEIQSELQSPNAAGASEDSLPQESPSPLAAMIDGKLTDAAGRDVPVPGPGVKYYAIYYSASWCPPCHAFTPVLVSWYRQFKPQHGDFELIFVSEDRSESEMQGYMTEMQMPWPAVKYAELPRTNGTFRGPGIQQFAGDGIPDLVLVDASGKVLADSFNGSTYVGPQSVVEYMNSNIGTP